MKDAARRIAGAMRSAAEREHERRGPGRHRGSVVQVSPLRVDLHGSDLDPLDGDDVTLGKSVTAAGPLAEGDVLVLIEVEDGEYVAVDVEED